MENITDATREYCSFVDSLEGKEITAEDAEQKERLYKAMSAEITAERQEAHNKIVADRQEELVDEVGEERMVKANDTTINKWNQTLELVKAGEVTSIDLRHTEYSTSGQPGLHTEFKQQGQSMVVQSYANDPSGNIEQVLLATGARNARDDKVGLYTQYATLTSTTDAPIPVSFIDMWSTEQAENGPMLDNRLCDVERTNRYHKRTYPRLDAEPAGIAVTAEGDNTDDWKIKSLPKTDPTFDEVEISMYKYGAVHAISDETLHSAYVSNFVGELAQVFTYRLAFDLNEDLTTGSGTNQPKGIVTAADAVTANRRQVTKTNAATTFTNHTVENGLKLFGDLDIGYSETRPTYFMARQDAAIQILLSDKQNRFTGAPIKEYGSINGRPGRQGIGHINGVNILANPHMENAPNKANSTFMLYGDFKAYKTLLGNMRLDFSTQLLFDKAALVMRVLQYAGGDLRACGGTRTGQKGRIVVLRNSA